MMTAFKTYGYTKLELVMVKEKISLGVNNIIYVPYIYILFFNIFFFISECHYRIVLIHFGVSDVTIL